MKIFTHHPFNIIESFIEKVMLYDRQNWFAENSIKMLLFELIKT